jgi:hypothetical protein
MDIHSLVDDGQVTFRWRDSAHNNEQKLMTLALDEFLRRFLLHLLPKSFVRIRHFGFLASRRRAQLLPLCFAALDSASAQTEIATSTALDINPNWFCPKCGGSMVIIERLTAAQIQLRSPPRGVDGGSMKSQSHFKNFACFAAPRRLVSCPRSTRSFTRLVMTNATTLQHPRTARSNDSLAPASAASLSAHIQFP